MKPRKLTALLAALSLAIAVSAPAGALAAPNPSGHGQPNASCEETSSAPLGFSSGGFANAEQHYAGNGAGSLHANSSHAVSQYDVACFQVSQH